MKIWSVKKISLDIWPLFVCINFLDTNQANCIEIPLPFPTDTEMLLIVLFWMSQGIKNFFSKASPCLSLIQKSFFVYIPPKFYWPSSVVWVHVYKPAWNSELALASAYHANKIIHKPDLCIPSMPFSSSPESEETEHLTNRTQ